MTIAEVLKQYPGPMKVQAPRTLYVVFPAVMSVFTGSLFFTGDYRYKVIAIVAGGFFALFALVNHFRPSTIELNGWGFTLKDYGGAIASGRWRDVSEFSVLYMGGFPSLQYFDRNDKKRPFGSKPRYLMNASPFRAGEMAELMNAWRSHSLGDE